MSIKKRVLFFVLALVVVLSGCSKSNDSGSDAEDKLVLGVIQSLTGSAAAYGESHDKGISIAIEEINKAGGVNGVPIEVYLEDDKSDPKAGIDSAKKLISTNKVDVIVGSSASLVTIAFSQENERSKIPLVNGYAGSPKITEQGFEYTWRVNPTDAMLDVKTIESIFEKEGPKKIAFLAENSDYGVPPIDAASEKVKELGGEVVSYEKYNRGETDFKAQLSKIKETNPDIVFTHGYYTEGSIIARQIKELGIDAQLIVNMGQGLPKFAELAGDAAEGVIFPTSWFPALTDEESQNFTKAYIEKYKEEPAAFEAGAYVAIKTVVEAVNKGGGATPEKIQEGLKQLNGFNVLYGELNFDENRQNDLTVLLANFKDGKIVEFK